MPKRTSKRTESQRISVMDTTLRDGEQTPDVAYTPAEKLQLARLLLVEVGVDRIEIASTRVSHGEREAARLVSDWARTARPSTRTAPRASSRRAWARESSSFQARKTSRRRPLSLSSTRRARGARVTRHRVPARLTARRNGAKSWRVERESHAEENLEAH